MRPPVEIVIPNYNGHEALALCLEAVMRRTQYPDYRVTVLNSPGDGQDAPYLRLLRDAGKIRLIEAPYRRRSGEAMYDLFAASKSDWACHLESDVEVMALDWLDILIDQIRDPDLDVVVARWAKGWWSDEMITVPVWSPEVFLLNLRLYRPLMEPGDFQQKSMSFAEYKYKDKLPEILPPGWAGYVNLDTCWRFTEKVTYENEGRFQVVPLLAGYYGTKVRHYGGLSTRPDHPEIQVRRARIRACLRELRETGK